MLRRVAESPHPDQAIKCSQVSLYSAILCAEQMLLLLTAWDAGETGMGCMFERCYGSAMSGACLTLHVSYSTHTHVAPSLGFGVRWWAAAARSNSSFWTV